MLLKNMVPLKKIIYIIKRSLEKPWHGALHFANMQASMLEFFQNPLNKGDYLFLMAQSYKVSGAKSLAKMSNFRAIFRQQGVLQSPWTIKYGAIRVISAFQMVQHQQPFKNCKKLTKWYQTDNFVRLKQQKWSYSLYKKKCCIFVIKLCHNISYIMIKGNLA